MAMVLLACIKEIAMTFIEWVFGRSHDEMMKQARDKCLERTQLVVDAFHGRMLNICGNKRDECSECWNDIPPEDEYWFNKCPNYERRCIARNAMHDSCKEIMKEFESDMDKAFIQSFNFIIRPFARMYVACGGLRKTRRRLEEMAESISKIAITLLAGAFILCFMASDADARKENSRPVAVSPIKSDSSAGSTVGNVVRDMGYDASKDDRQAKVPVSNQPQMQKLSTTSRNCRCQGN